LSENSVQKIEEENMKKRREEKIDLRLEFLETALTEIIETLKNLSKCMAYVQTSLISKSLKEYEKWNVNFNRKEARKMDDLIEKISSKFDDIDIKFSKE